MELHDREIVICPPAIYLQQLNGLMGDVQLLLGGQDISEKFFGAFTGDISGQMLKEFGCKYTLVGHSERRARYLESDELVASKVKTALSCGLIPIICIGESKEEREAGQMKEVLKRQLLAATKDLNEELERIKIAYEPIWAIGTGLSASAEQVQDVHAFIRDELKILGAFKANDISILYGGSVKSENAKEFLSLQDVDGLLVGGASLIASEFIEICLSEITSK
jgi:triosephosphate isomerase